MRSIAIHCCVDREENERRMRRTTRSSSPVTTKSYLRMLSPRTPSLIQIHFSRQGAFLQGQLRPLDVLMIAVPAGTNLFSWLGTSMAG